MSNQPTNFVSAIRGGRIVIALIAIAALLAVAGRLVTAAYVEVLWQSQAGYLSAFWRRIAWEWGTRIGAGLVVGVLVYLNLRVASTTLGGIQIRRRFGNLEISEKIPQRYVTWSMLAAAGFLGLWFGATVSAIPGRETLLAFAAQPWGAVDPILGRDLGFYVFWLPVLERAVAYGLVATFLVFTLATGGYSATGALTWVRGKLRAQPVVRVHLGAILAVFFVLLAARLWLGRYALLLDGNSEVQAIFGYADAQARLPALQTLTVISLAAAAATVWGAFKQRAWPIVASFAAIVVGGIVIGNLYPSLVQSFRVEPNELERESPYIEHSLEFTRRGFGLGDLERRIFSYEGAASVDWTAASEQFMGLPVWNDDALLTTYREREARFPYYDFARVAIDRYPTPDGVAPVAMSVREVDRVGIQDPNWQNLHLRELYIEGVGVVASLAATRTNEGRPEMLVSGLPPAVRTTSVPVEDLALERPQIFFGLLEQQPYAVVTPGPEQYLAPDGSPGVPGVDFPEGIQLVSGLREALLAWHFGAVNLIFASELDERSRLVHRRRVEERALAIAPFLRFPEDPYPVVANGRVMWILDGFTATDEYPLSAVQDLGLVRRAVRYVRNSVKVTVDAVSGDIDFYRVPVDDPLADAYERAYPDLFKPIEEMPGELRRHLRYPRALLGLQSRVLLQYHQETARAFHGQQDVWRSPEELGRGSSPVPYAPEYAVYRLPGEDPRFQLTTLFTPQGRENLTAVLVARTDDRGVPETILMDIPVEVLGPRQIEARIEQDPIISEQFSLWRTGGSQVWTGHLHVVPVGRRFVYLEAVFLAAESDAIPELRRFVVSDGERVVMAESLEQAVAVLSGGEADGTVIVAGEEGPAGAAGIAEDSGGGRWPAEALSLLERAEQSARGGDWQGFGEALEELRALLERLGTGEGG